MDRRLPPTADLDRPPLRDQLLDAALDLLAASGPAAVRVRDVAERAGCSTMGVYTCFGSKDGLLEALYAYGFEQLEQALAAVPHVPDPAAHVLHMALAYRRFALDQPALYALMFERAMPDFTPSPPARLASLASYQRFAAACAPLGAPPEWAAYVLFCTAHGLVSLELTHRRWGGPIMPILQPFDPEQTFRRGLEALLRGLVGPTPGPAPGAA